MNYITDFYKLILLILCLLILYVTIQNFNLESFQTYQVKETEKGEEEIKKPEKVEFTIDILNNNMKTNRDKKFPFIDKYIIIIYADNQGSYIKIIDRTTSERYFSYVLRTENNIIYKK